MKFNCIYRKDKYYRTNGTVNTIYSVQKYITMDEKQWPDLHDLVRRLIVDIDISTKEEYLKWVSAWKKVHALLVAEIKRMKASRKTAENGYVPGLREVQYWMTELYRFRRIYKLAAGVLRQKHIDKKNSR